MIGLSILEVEGASPIWPYQVVEIAAEEFKQCDLRMIKEAMNAKEMVYGTAYW